MTDEIPPPLDGPLDHFPKIVGHHGVAEYVFQKYDGLELTPSYVRDQCVAGNIAYYIIGGKRHFSEKEIYEWLMTRRPRKYSRAASGAPKSEVHREASA